MSLQSDYDIWHSKFHNLDPSHDNASSPWYKWVRESIGKVQGLQTLEVACGRGGFVIELTRAGACACGLDFSFSAISIAKTKASLCGPSPPSCFIQGDAHALPFPDNSFDLLISCETIEHLPSPLKALREFHRVTRPGGKLFLTTPNYLNFMGLYELYALLRRRNRFPDQPFDRIQFFYQTRRLLRDAGWKILRSDGTVHQFPFFPGKNPVRVERLESNTHFRKLLSIFALHYCLIAKKGES